MFSPNGPEQCAAPGRQTSDVLFSLCHIYASYPGSGTQSLALIRMDIAQAFDSLDSVRLAETLLKEVGPYYPRETMALVDPLQAGVTKVDTLWGRCSFRNGVGVKQGSVESPTMFAWLMDLILVVAKNRRADNSQWMEGLSVDGAAFMDDVISWAAATSTPQSRVEELQALLGQWGLSINLEKCALLCHGAVGVRAIPMGGCTLHALPENTPLAVMGTPIGPRVTVMEILESFMERARACFRAKHDSHSA